MFVRATALLVVMLLLSTAAAADFSLFRCGNMGETHAERCCPADHEEPVLALMAARCCESERFAFDAPRSIASSKLDSVRPPSILVAIEPPLTVEMAPIEPDYRVDARPPPILLMKCVLLV